MGKGRDWQTKVVLNVRERVICLGIVPHQIIQLQHMFVEIVMVRAIMLENVLLPIRNYVLKVRARARVTKAKGKEKGNHFHQ